MTCVPGGPFEFLTRPYPYKRQPFQLASGELVTYEGIYFSIPASGLMLDKRLFTDEDSHPVVSDVKLYINKDATLGPVIEPDDDGTVYLSGTPHYNEFITDLRDLITDVTALHAADSDHLAQQFFEDHLKRTRATYDFSSITVAAGEYVHPEPATTIPSGASPPGSSGSIPPPGDGFELGAQQIMDIDVDEIQWQAIARPKKLANDTPQNIPVEPIFPAVLPGGSLPTFNSLDVTNLSELAINGPASGGVLITGDGLVAGTSIKFSTASGLTPAATGSFDEVVPWKLFPCGLALCTYYSPHEDSTATINVRGRQAVYSAPGSLSDGVYLLAASSSSETSGLAVQHYPANYQATSGVDANGVAHNGVHITDKVIYNLNAGGSTIKGFSPLNGKPVFLHWVGTETGSRGETFAGSGPKYQNGDTVFTAGNIVNPALSNFTRSTQNWSQTGFTFSPINWSTLSTTALVPTRGIFGAPNSTVYRVADIQAGSTRGVITRKEYAQWGFIDQLVAPDQDQAQGGQRQVDTVFFNTIEYAEGTDADGNFTWVKIGESQTSQDVVSYRNTFFVGNIFSFFFLRKPNNGLVHVNGNVYVQWSDKTGFTDILPRKNKFAPIGQGTTQLVPASARSDVTVSIGFFPAWKLRRYVTTNTQVEIPDSIPLSPANSLILSFDPLLDYDDSEVVEFGPPVWDPDKGVNYIYFADSFGRRFFAEFDTDFVIKKFNRVGNSDGFLTGRAALLSV